MPKNTTKEYKMVQMLVIIMLEQLMPQVIEMHLLEHHLIMFLVGTLDGIKLILQLNKQLMIQNQVTKLLMFLQKMVKLQQLKQKRRKIILKHHLLMNQVIQILNTIQHLNQLKIIKSQLKIQILNIKQHLNLLNKLIQKVIVQIRKKIHILQKMKLPH